MFYGGSYGFPMTEILTALADHRRINGRGARSNSSSRYDREERVRVDDGWSEDDDRPTPFKTEVIRDATRTIIARNDSPDISFDRSINPYRGCEHGCIYCFARPTHAYLGLSPGIDFETKLLVKPDAARLLEAELRKPGYQVRTMAIGTNTDPYQPIEREWRVMRSILQVLWDFRHPVGIVTKSALIARDIDILSEMAKENLVRVALSVTTLDRGLARSMEPRAATPPRRIETIRALAAAGIPASVMFAPVIPALNDDEMEAVLAAAAEAGARSAGYVMLRMPLEIKDLFREWLVAHAPDRGKHVLSLMKSMRGGKDYDAAWGKRMSGTGPYANMIAQRFQIAVRRLKLNEKHEPLDTAKFRRPVRQGDQLALAI
jgi:DNA repair photolyase